MRTPNRTPAVEYRNPGQSFNAPTIRQATKSPPQTGATGKQVSGSQPQRKTAWETFWGQFAGQQLVFQCKSGAIIEGTFASLEKNYIRVVDVTIMGKSNRIQTDWIIIEINGVAHFHPAAQPDSKASNE